MRSRAGPSAPEFDAVIAGGGLSGLSLAAHLARQGWRDRSVLVVDDPDHRPPAVCWGFWSAGPGLLDAAVSRTYAQVRIHAEGSTRAVPLGSYRYRLVRRADLERAVRGLLADCPGFHLVAGRVEGVHDDGDSATVTVDGRTVRGRWAFDSVTAPPAGTPVDARLSWSWPSRGCSPPTPPSGCCASSTRTARYPTCCG